MKEFVDALHAYIAQQKINFGDGDAQSLLEMLFIAYTQRNGFDDETIRKDFDALYEAMNGKSLQEIDRVIDPVCTLCRDHEKAGFIQGILLGVRLERELSE